jgi:hypothetical protein
MIFGRCSASSAPIIAVPIIASIQIVVQELTAARRAEMAALREDGGAVPPGAAAAAQAL